MEDRDSTQKFDLSDEKRYSSHLSPGTTLQNRYLIESILGVGGMGAVYRARDLHFPNVIKWVAVKEMVNRAADPVVRATIVRNFEREANLLASLDHRAIPRIYDFFTVEERSYLVEEYIQGQDLETIITNAPDFIPQERVIRWAIELCDVLHYLHTHTPQPIVFRDMKPSNVIINQHDHVVLVDFGIAKPFQGDQKGTMIGTEGYSPPEQYRGEASPLADIYALGATLHHLLTRRDPRLEAPFSFHERPIRKINPAISPGLEEIINKALQYNPQDRFQSALEMKEALLLLAKESGFLLPHTPSQERHRETEGIKPLWEFECEDEIRGAPLYHNDVLYIGCYDNNLYALNAKNGQFIWKYAAEGGVVSRPALYEDSLYIGSVDRRLHAIFLRTGKVNWTYFTDGPIFSSPTIVSGYVFIGSDDGYLHVVNALNGHRVWRMEAGAPIRSTPLVHNDYIYLGTEAGDFFCLDLGGQIRWRFRARRAITASAVISRHLVYFGSVDGNLYALDAANGWAVWRHRIGKPTISTPCLMDNFLFSGAVSGDIFCLDAYSGREIWRFTTQNQVTGSPIIHRDSLYCGSVDGYFYCLEYRTGRLRWKFRSAGPITGTPVAHEDFVYIGSTDHRVYALLA